MVYDPEGIGARYGRMGQAKVQAELARLAEYGIETDEDFQAKFGRHLLRGLQGSSPQILRNARATLDIEKYEEHRESRTDA